LFEGLGFHLRAGGALQVLGPNGTGKSSVLRLAAGLLRVDAGRVERSPAALADDKLALDRELPLGRALRFWGSAADDAMEALGIAHLAGVPVRLLSSGQMKRASLARVAASAARLWLLDEPLNGLDSDGERRLGPVMSAHLDRGGAILAASHQPLPGQWQTLDLGR
jgi:heme exporter protein A